MAKMKVAKGTGLKKSFLDQLKRLEPGQITAAAKGSSKRLAMQMIAAVKQKATPRARPHIGKLYHYQYDPKLKETLPYYDMYPVVIPIRYYSNGWLGLNLHYIDQAHRAALMDRLVQAYQVGKNATTRLQISYQMLNGASRMEAFRPCVKRYLADYLKSQPLEIDRSDWFTVIALPLARFKKASEAQVHADSRRKF